jgi:hypothetical protein
MTKPIFHCRATLKQYPSERATWYVVTLDIVTAAKIFKTYSKQQGGFGSLPVRVTLGQSSWDTSIFRDRRAKSYLLFIKASIRKKEMVRVGDEITFHFSLRVS